MRLTIDHRTGYRFTEPQARLVQMLRVTPTNSHDQTVASWRIDVDCDARLREHRDGFGNLVTMLYAEGPLDGIEIAVSGEVLTSHSDGVLHGVAEVLPPAVFLRATPTTTEGERLRGFADAALADVSDPLERLHRLNAALFDRFRLDVGRARPDTTPEQAFDAPTATSRDLAQMFVAAARARGLPARYVSGYCEEVVEGDHRPTAHAWAEAHVERLGWVGFDPSLGLSPEERHVRVAVALDAAGAAPVAGSRLGEGDEVLDVDVVVSSEH